MSKVLTLALMLKCSEHNRGNLHFFNQAITNQLPFDGKPNESPKHITQSLRSISSIRSSNAFSF